MTCHYYIMSWQQTGSYATFYTAFNIVGPIGEKMFTIGSKCNFFHKISQYDANAGNPDTVTGSTFDHLFSLWLSFTLPLGDVKSIAQKPEHLQCCSHFTCQFTHRIETTVPHCRRIGQIFIELRPSQKLKFYPKIGVDRNATSLFDQ